MPRRKPGYKYSVAQKQRILAIAQKEGLTGPQVKKRFGVSVLTFYRWRGPVRRRPARAAAGDPGVDLVRATVRAQVEKALPRIVREQVLAYLRDLLGRRRGRRRGRRQR